MKALILAAGFGTRLECTLNGYQGPHREQLIRWVKDKPKGLVPVLGKPIVSHQLGQLTSAGVELKDIYVQTNQRFYDQFLGWAIQEGIPQQNIFNNEVTHNEERKEQVQDILLAIERIGYDGPLFLFASDTLVYGKGDRLLDLSPMVEIYRQQGLSSIVAYHKESGASHHGVITVDKENMITSFREKPLDVESGLVNASVYLLSSPKLKQMKDSAEELLKYKNPLQLLWNDFKIIQAGSRVDLGTIEDLLRANNVEKRN
ncbi:MAG: sugar phosphate nucleotidyltransferase [Nanoarchaeota archaeon]|nr:sugar phosphate nucleotidyltransferase [Nanoarchaeota archaeon]